MFKKWVICLIVLTFGLTAPLFANRNKNSSYDWVDDLMDEVKLHKVLQVLVINMDDDELLKKNIFISVSRSRDFNAYVDSWELKGPLGDSERYYSIKITRGLMDVLNDEEEMAIIAHELGHIANGDLDRNLFKRMRNGLIRVFSFNQLGSTRFSEQVKANEFAVILLKHCGVNPGVLLWAYEKQVEAMVMLYKSRSSGRKAKVTSSRRHRKIISRLKKFIEQVELR